MNSTNLRAVLTLSVVAVLLSGTACKRNHPPSIPEVTGPLIYRPGDTARLSVTSTDQDDDLTSYLFGWGDTNSAVWSTDHPSGVTVTGSHVYTDSGVYAVRIRARDDKDAESDWSPTESLRVGIFLPGVPARPQGQAIWDLGVAYACSTRATSPYGESLRIQFDWAGQLGSWDGPVASDSLHVGTRTFDSAGPQVVRARSMDKVGIVSAWSDSLVVVIAAQAPSIPTRPDGPDSVIINAAAIYRTWSQDPNGDSLSYIFDWSDGTVDTSATFRSGDTASCAHAWSSTGTFHVKAEALDPRGNRSPGWSDSLVVAVFQVPPGKPITPVGQQYCTTGVAYSYKVMAIHPQGESLQFQFDWDGTVGNWGNLVASGETTAVNHAFDSAGNYLVSARARVEAGFPSPWSDPLSVTAVRIPGGSARNLSIRAATFTTVKLTWSPPVEGVPNVYRVIFTPVGQSPVVALETGDTTCVLDPEGLTGQYRVVARFGNAFYEPRETLSTIPIHTGTTTIGEVNGTENPGCGWPEPGRFAATYEMSDTAWVDSVDFYVTDFKLGSGGPTYFLASPDLAPADSGGVPPGRWHVASFAKLADEQGPVPPFGDTAWKSTARVPAAMVAACQTDQGYIAIVKVTELRVQNKDLRMEAWFQPVRGLCLLRH